MVIGAMILMAFLGIYNRVQQSVGAVFRNLAQFEVPAEVLQRITEDFDHMLLTGDYVQMTILIKPEKGYTLTRLTIQKNILNDKNENQIFEQIIWQTTVDLATGRLTLYRGYSGLAPQDRWLDVERKEVEKLYPFVPVCTGLSLFRVQIPQADGTLTDQWTSTTLPNGVRVTLSFAEPFATVQKDWEVREQDRISRTLAIDRTRMIRFEVVREGLDANTPPIDANQVPQEPLPRREPNGRS